MNLLNNEAGRVAVASLMKNLCRCHGISGSCELKTCWRSLPPFQEVGARLKDRYENSVAISQISEVNKGTQNLYKSK
jgi:wingless-type MMTV integration site family protein 16